MGLLHYVSSTCCSCNLSTKIIFFLTLSFTLNHFSCLLIHPLPPPPLSLFIKSCVECGRRASYMPFLIGTAIGVSFLGGLAILAWKRGTFMSMVPTHMKRNQRNNASSTSTSTTTSLSSFCYCFQCIPWLVDFLTNHIDRGALKVIWSCYQIIGTVSWNLSIAFPSPFNKVIFGLGFLQVRG